MNASGMGRAWDETNRGRAVAGTTKTAEVFPKTLVTQPPKLPSGRSSIPKPVQYGELGLHFLVCLTLKKSDLVRLFMAGGREASNSKGSWRRARGAVAARLRNGDRADGLSLLAGQPADPKRNGGNRKGRILRLMERSTSQRRKKEIIRYKTGRQREGRSRHHGGGEWNLQRRGPPPRRKRAKPRGRPEGGGTADDLCGNRDGGKPSPGRRGPRIKISRGQDRC